MLLGEEAEKLEAALGIPVLRHTEKKPAGEAGTLEKHFGWGSLCLATPQHGMPEQEDAEDLPAGWRLSCV
jgi:hypothetical protein